jgi:hypothetical protein
VPKESYIDIRYEDPKAFQASAPQYNICEMRQKHCSVPAAACLQETKTRKHNNVKCKILFIVLGIDLLNFKPSDNHQECLSMDLVEIPLASTTRRISEGV